MWGRAGVLLDLVLGWGFLPRFPLLVSSIFLDLRVGLPLVEWGQALRLLLDLSGLWWCLIVLGDLRLAISETIVIDSVLIFLDLKQGLGLSFGVQGLEFLLQRRSLH